MVTINSSKTNNNIDKQLSLAEKYLNELEFEEAIAVFNEVVKLDPRNAKAYLGLEKAYEGLGNREQAINSIKEGLERTLSQELTKEEVEDLAKLYIKLIELYETLERYEEAVIAVKEGYEFTKDPDLKVLYDKYYPSLENSLQAGEHEEGEIINLATNGSKIYYTTDGSEPSKDSMVYTDGIALTRDMELKVVVENEYGQLGNTSNYLYKMKFDDYVIEWEDKTIEQNVRQIIGKPTGDVKYSDVQEITSLNVIESGIVNIDDIRHFKNLTDLWMDGNQISDISALSGLTNLTDLGLSGNEISDISALSGLTNLTKLLLESNQISDISVLSGLTNLTDLDLDNNQISDISALSGLTNLTELELSGNQISDWSPIQHVTDVDGRP